MKRITFVAILLLSIGYVFYQNQGRLFLILLSQHRLSNPFQTTQKIVAARAIPSYKNGIYTGDVANAFYGNVQVKAVITNGKVANVQFLQHPQDATRSVIINTIAMPNLTQEAVQSQSANVDIVSGATATSSAFITSLQSALSQAAK